MAKNNLRRFYVLALLVATAALEIGASQARAYWGWGGFGSFNYVPQPGDFVNQHALSRAGTASRPASNNVYANNPNSYINRVRDNGFIPHYSPESRWSPAYQWTSRRRSPNVTQTSNNQPQPATAPAGSAPIPTVARPVLPIGSFFDPARRLVWPNDAPVADGLDVKRDISDQACLAVSDLVDLHRSAPITTVTDARQKLLNYGQPALQVVRSRTTPRVAESFHLFLLSLYDSLGQAANPLGVPSAASSTP